MEGVKSIRNTPPQQAKRDRQLFKHIVIVLYSHPEHFPPTLSAISSLSKIVEKITVLYRPSDPLEWPFPKNVELIPIGRTVPVAEQHFLSAKEKLGLFFKFFNVLRKLCNREKPEVVLLYDPIPVAIYSFARRFINYKPLVWYHNHDVMDAPDMKMFSTTWLAVREEPLMFPHLDIFSLPSEDRKQFFPMDKLKGQYFFLPNHPSKYFYTGEKSADRDDTVIRLIFQGQNARNRGFEEVISMLPLQVSGREVHLVLKGRITKEYKNELMNLAASKGAADKLIFLGFSSYKELPKATASSHIGLALFTENTIMTSTIGTASNKIYEYAAAGLPILYFDTDYFRGQLGKYKWAFGTDLQKESFAKCLEHIVLNYEEVSKQARNDFEAGMNYETAFEPIKNYLKTKAKIL